MRTIIVLLFLIRFYSPIPYHLRYTGITDTEAGAIFQYLKTIPPISNKLERSVFQ